MRDGTGNKRSEMYSKITIGQTYQGFFSPLHKRHITLIKCLGRYERKEGIEMQSIPSFIIVHMRLRAKLKSEYHHFFFCINHCKYFCRHIAMTCDNVRQVGIIVNRITRIKDVCMVSKPYFNLSFQYEKNLFSVVLVRFSLSSFIWI